MCPQRAIGECTCKVWCRDRAHAVSLAASLALKIETCIHTGATEAARDPAARDRWRRVELETVAQLRAAVRDLDTFYGVERGDRNQACGRCDAGAIQRAPHESDPVGADPQE